MYFLEGPNWLQPRVALREIRSHACLQVQSTSGSSLGLCPIRRQGELLSSDKQPLYEPLATSSVTEQVSDQRNIL